MMKLPKFSRNADSVDGEDSGVRMPEGRVDARVSAMTISSLLTKFEDFTNPESADHGMYPWADRFAMGYPLAPWQRQAVWSRDQQIRFINSIWARVDLGSYLINDQFELAGPSGKRFFRPFSEILLDGQQRLTAIEHYVLNEFGVKDASGIERFWAELPRIERRRFANTQFSRGDVHSWDEAILREVYDLRAFGGTAHDEAERASDVERP